MKGYRRLKRSGLFLLRIWTEIGDASDDTSKPICRGRVQRVVDGETRMFNDWQELFDLLRVMLKNE